MSRYRLSKGADANLEEIADGPINAVAVLEALHSTFQVLADHPNVATLRADLLPGIRVFSPPRPANDYVDLANNPMIVRSNKTPPAHSFPVFPELRKHLLRVREMAPAGAALFQTRYSHDANIRTTPAKVVTKAGLVPWSKLRQNLRATRQTELLAHYPAKDVTS